MVNRLILVLGFVGCAVPESAEVDPGQLDDEVEDAEDAEACPFTGSYTITADQTAAVVVISAWDNGCTVLIESTVAGECHAEETLELQLVGAGVWEGGSTGGTACDLSASDGTPEQVPLDPYEIRTIILNHMDGGGVYFFAEDGEPALLNHATVTP